MCETVLCFHVNLQTKIMIPHSGLCAFLACFSLIVFETSFNSPSFPPSCSKGCLHGPHYSTERNGTESVVALFYGTERNTASMVNFHKSNLML